MHPVFSRTQNGRPAQLICPCLIGRKDLMTKFYPAAVGDTANAGSHKVFVRDAGHDISAP